MMRKIARSLTFFDIWVVGGCVAASFISQRVLPFAVASAVIFGLIRWIANGRFSKPTPVDLPIAIIFLMSLVTLLATAELDVTLPQVLRLLAGIGVYYAVVNWTITPNRMHWLVRGIWLAALLIGLYAFFSVQWNTTKLFFIPATLYTHFRILVNDPTNPNAMAAILVILGPCVLGVLFYFTRQLIWFDKGLAIISASVIILVLILTQSRGGLFTFIVVLFVLVALRWKRGWWFLAGAIVMSVVILILFGPMAVINEIMANVTLGGMDGRIEVWSRAVYMIQDFPFTGVGMGSYNRVADLLYPFFLYEPGTTIFSHNLFLQVAVDLGIPGLVAWLSIWFLIVSVTIQMYREGRIFHNNWVCGLAAGLLCSQLGLAIHGMLDAATWGVTKSAPLVWVLWGVTVAGWNVYAKRT